MRCWKLEEAGRGRSYRLQRELGRAETLASDLQPPELREVTCPLSSATQHVALRHSRTWTAGCSPCPRLLPRGAILAPPHSPEVCWSASSSVAALVLAPPRLRAVTAGAFLAGGAPAPLGPGVCTAPSDGASFLPVRALPFLLVGHQRGVPARLTDSQCR